MVGGRGFGVRVDLVGWGEEAAAVGVVSFVGDGDDGGVHFGSLLAAVAHGHCWFNKRSLRKEVQ
uniref:Uncharacterized protein n=1 Tax=Arundo donax TaxID=35708 RepID=A0A0A8YLY2_ARUDO